VSDPAYAPLYSSVRFDARFAARLDRFALGVRAADERREGGGRAGLAGGVGEFAFHRPYRPGDDVRRLDWDLFARLDQAYVKVARRESAEHWLVSIDTSASMGAGPPGKLQLAAEVAAGLAAIALAQKGEARVVASNTSGLHVRSRRDLPRILAFLESLSATGVDEPRVLPAHGRAVAQSARVFVVGDLFGWKPRDVLPLARRRSLCVFQVLAPCELEPPAIERIRWWDPERARTLDLANDASTTARYVARLAREQEEWRTACARRRALFHTAQSDTAFETVLTEALVR
jgi:uncharacterized protein (DUF58 family)